MKHIFLLACIFCFTVTASKAQTLKLGYFDKIPAAIKDCGAVYTYDSVSLRKKKYIMLVDFQNLGMIFVAGKQIKLQLSDSKLENGKNNITTYTGSGYTVILSARTTNQTDKMDMEEGKLEVIKGKIKLSFKIHGHSYCDPSKQESNNK